MPKRPKLASIAIALLLALSATVFVLHQAGSLPYRVYVVHTGSMIPTIPPESAVVVREGDYHVGEVVSFVEHGNVVSHRLMAIHPNGRITTKGDANRTADPWHVPASNIIGGVVAAPRHLGYLLTYVRSPLGAASILMALMCLWQVWALARAISEQRPEAVAAE
jgi:signal peptidase